MNDAGITKITRCAKLHILAYHSSVAKPFKFKVVQGNLGCAGQGCAR